MGPMNGEGWDYGGGLGGGLGIGNMTLADMQSSQATGLSGMSSDDFEYGDMDDYGGGGLGNMSLDDFGGGGLGGMTLDDMPASMGGGLGDMTLDDMTSNKESTPGVSNSLHENILGGSNATAGASMEGHGLGIDTSDLSQRLSAHSNTAVSKPHSHASSVSIKRKPVGGQKAQEQDDFYFE